jgi:radical SAM protein with 4Fe4S-binding SPASM domain
MSFVDLLKNNIFYLKSKIRNQKSYHSGLYHYERQWTGEDMDMSGLLLVNANRVMYLNPTAAFMTWLTLEEFPVTEAIRSVTKQYKVPANQVIKDYAQINDQITELIRPNGACPIHELEIDITHPFSARPSAPYRMDIALTYRCNNDCPHCYNIRPRVISELKSEQWKRVLERIWELGIPHVVFTGGEPTLRNDLCELIAYGEQIGLITGLNTNARRLSDPQFVENLVSAGLDHVQVTVESHNAEIHNQLVQSPNAWKETISGLRNVLDTPLYVMTNTTMLRENSPFLDETLAFLTSLGVPTIGLNALIFAGRGRTVGTGLNEKKLNPLLEMARDHTEANNQRLIWYTPTQYCNFDPMQLELGVKGCTAALYNMCIEPDGRVIPCQSFYKQLGDILSDPWETIWNHEIAVNLRERKYIDEKCEQCVLLSECGGGCPLYTKEQGYAQILSDEE